MRPGRVDALVDLTYGVLILVSIALIVVLDTQVGLAFGFGVFAAYAVHVVWKMARFDPEWMTREVQESVEQTVEETVEETVEQTVPRTVEQTVEETVVQRVGDVQRQVEEVEQRVDRRPREDQVEELIEESVERERDDGSDGA